MAKKSTQKPQKVRLRPFELRFFLEGGSSVWMAERAESRAVLENHAKRLLDGPGSWVTIEAHSGTLHMRRAKVVGFQVDDLRAPELSREPPKAWPEQPKSKLSFFLGNRDIRVEKKP